MPVTTDVYQLLYEGLRDGWLALEDLDPDLAGVQVWLAVAGRCPLHPAPAPHCRNLVVWELDAGGGTARDRHCDPDASGPAPDSQTVVAVRVLWADGSAEVLGPGHGPYFHRLVARHRPGP